VEGINAMSDTVFAYLISLGIIGAGVVWIIAGSNVWWYGCRDPALCIAIGILSIGVGAISLLNEVGNRAQ
jgi:hypothetical protein